MLFESLKRLHFVGDISLLPDHPLAASDATVWKCATFVNPGPAHLFPGGFSLKVVSNPLLTWYRSFTHDGTPPPSVPYRSRFSVHEWQPYRQPKSVPAGFHRLTSPKFQAISWLDESDHLKKWSQHARRHLRAFQKQSGVRLRLGTVEDIRAAYGTSQVPPDLRAAFNAEVERHIIAHPETIEILVAESDELGILGVFVAGNCDEARSSYYLLGFFVPKAARLHVMPALVDWWHRRSKERKYLACNFGWMVGPRPMPLHTWNGYSLFKTHFGVSRVWIPGSYWKFSKQ